MGEAKVRPDVELLATVSLIDQRVRLALERVLPADLGAGQFAVLAQLDRGGVPQTPGDLASAAGVSRGAMTATLRKLEVRGLAKIVGDDVDGRRKWVSITADGRQSLQACMTSARASREALRRAFGAREFEQALPFLRRLLGFLNESR